MEPPEDLPRDVVLHLLSLLPPRVGRLVCRGSRDAVDATAVEELDLRWRGGGLGGRGDAPSLDGALSLLNGGRLPRLSRVAFAEPERQGGHAVRALLTALRERADVAARGAGPGRPGLRSLSLASTSAIDATARGQLAAVLRAHTGSLERLDARLSVFDVADTPSSSAFCGALGALSRLRSLSIGTLDGASMRLAAGTIAALPALERLEVEVVSAADASDLWTALGAPAPGRAPAHAPLRELTVASFFSHPTDRRLELAELQLSLPSLTSLDVGVGGAIGPCVSQLTALRSLRVRNLDGWDVDGESIDARRALAALAPLTALTRLEVLGDPYFQQWPAAPAAPRPAPALLLLPLLRVLSANRLVPALLQRPGSLPALAELSCTPPASEALQRRFAELLRLRLPQLASLSVRSWDGAHTPLGRPSELAGLTRLAAHSADLSLSPSAPPPWRWSLPSAGFFGWPRRPEPAPPPSRLARLEVDMGPDCDLGELLRGLPRLSSLKISCAHLLPEAARALGRALAPLGALVELELAGLPATVLAMLRAAAADPSTAARVQRLTLSPHHALTDHQTAQIAALAAAFAAVRRPDLRAPAW